jgi:uncharacterized phage-associated protein
VAIASSLKFNMTNITADDVATYLLQTAYRDGLPQLKLQKLLYYCQMWYAAHYNEPLFSDPIQAWVNGPVVPTFWNRHRLEYWITPGSVAGDARRLSQRARHLVDGVIRVYGDYDGVQLSQMTHSERPWQVARASRPSSERGSDVIDPLEGGRFYRDRLAIVGGMNAGLLAR